MSDQTLGYAQNNSRTLKSNINVFKVTLIGVFSGALAGYCSSFSHGVQFPLGFGIIGFFYALYLTRYLKFYKNNFFNFIFNSILFTMGGIAYPCILNVIFEMPVNVQQYDKYEVYNLLLFFSSIAAGLFVFIFSITILSLRQLVNKIIKILTYLSLFIVLVVSIKFYFIWISMAVSHFLVLSAIVLATMSIFSKSTFETFKTNLVVLLLIVFLIPYLSLKYIGFGEIIDSLSWTYLLTIILLSVTLTFVGNFIFIIRSSNRTFQPKIIIEWFFLFFSIITNYTLLFSLLCFIPYQRTVSLLKYKNQINENDIKISKIFTGATILIHLIMLFIYQYLLRNVWNGNLLANELLTNLFLWSAVSAVAGYSLSKAIKHY